MILFKSIRWKNLFSTGNQPTEIQLDKSPTTLILGVNGSGKSTFLDAICYVLFKKPFRKVNKAQLVNTINEGDCEIDVEFMVGKTYYKVRRGIKPDYFEIYIDGVLRKQEGARKDDQSYLEQDILKLNYESFVQVVILGNAKYTPFMQLDAAKRRKFIEQILDIGVFSSMNVVLGNRVKALKGEIDSTLRSIVVVQEQITLVEDFIAKCESDRQKESENSQSKIDDQNAIIDELAPLIDDLVEKINLANDELQIETAARNEAMEIRVEELQEQLADTAKPEDDLRKLMSIRPGLVTGVANAQARVEFYSENAACKSCGHTLEVEVAKTILEEKKAALEKHSESLAKLDEKIQEKKLILQGLKKENESCKALILEVQTKARNEVRKLTTDMQVTIRDLTKDLQAKQSTSSAARQFIKKLQADMKKVPVNLQEQQDKLKGFNLKLGDLEVARDEGVEQMHFYDVATVLLKDTGIKAAIIKQYLPTINKLVNKYLADLDFFVSFSLDENFNEEFKSRHRDSLQYYSFSEGEKLRIDLALLLAWRDIARMKNSCSTNLLILDEVIDSSLDQNGTDFFIKMLNSLGEVSNVFVISHKNDSALDKFKDVLRFGRIGNFSQLVGDA